MPTVYLTQSGGTKEITGLLQTWSWGGDKASIARKWTASILYEENSGWPVPALGNVVSMVEGETLFEGYVVHRGLDSEGHTLDFYCYDKGIYLKNNDGTYKFTDTSAEAIVKTVCRDKGVPIDSLASTGVSISRKFSGVKLSKIVSTAYTLAAEETGARYAIRMTPKGLLVKVKTQSASSLKLRPKSNLIRASTTESIVNMVNQVAIYDQNGELVDVVKDQAAVALYGVMEQHLTQKSGKNAYNEAAAALEDGAMERNVTVDVLGDVSLITGETVVVEEQSTGLQGVFWIESDTHTWKRGVYQTQLTLNCRNVMTKTTAGSEIT
jgi:hypothetical protein